ncbi:PIN domain-containing protein [Alicyclobacillus fodiniaquatilis]|uniref:PIN domain-containing protein n=1 Tax=Alicyclobacillus fodiniaquatilis TaxID=1661150 RepID=A0ABW4JI69_9BACL
MTNVFLDTQIYINKNFSFQTGQLKALAEAALDGRITIYITDVVKKEVEANIHKAIYESVRKGTKHIRTDLKVLRNLAEYQSIFVIKDRLDEIYADLLGLFHEFLATAAVETVNVDDVKPSDVFERYFNGDTPFSARKKDEFPDAFSLLAIEHKSIDVGETFHVVSGDTDAKHFCEDREGLLHHKSLDELFDFFNQNDEYNHGLIVSTFQHHTSRVVDLLTEEFPMQVFDLLGEEGDVEHVTVRHIELLDDPLVLKYDRHENGKVTATIAIDTSVDYTAEFSFQDYANGVWDSEDKRYVFVETVHSERELDGEDVTAGLELEFHENDPDHVDIQLVSINNSEPIMVQSFEPEW